MPSRSFSLSLFVFLSVLSIEAFAQSWVGNYSYLSERSPKGQCSAEAAISNNKIIYGDWDRQRAVLSNLCFQVYVQGITDRKEIDPSLLDVSIYAPYKYPARFVAKSGNNYVYAISLKDLDPVLHGIASNGNTQKHLEVRGLLYSTLGNFSYAQGEVIKIEFTN